MGGLPPLKETFVGSLEFLTSNRAHIGRFMNLCWVTSPTMAAQHTTSFDTFSSGPCSLEPVATATSITVISLGMMVPSIEPMISHAATPLVTAPAVVMATPFHFGHLPPIKRTPATPAPGVQCPHTRSRIDIICPHKSMLAPLLGSLHAWLIWSVIPRL